jgi:broad specificity phosphatase PhoE
MECLRLYLLRHGQTMGFDRRPFNGWRDVGLTDLGKAQLDDAAAALGNIPFDALYSSDLQRARYGGEALAKASGKALTQLAAFREMSFGDCEGLTFPEIERRFPALARAVARPQDGPVSFPGGESDKAFQARVSGAVGELLARHPAGRVALVSHAGVGRAILAHFLGLDTAAMWSIHQDFAGLHVLDVFQGGSYVIRALNAYLGPEGYREGGPGFEALLGLARF